jgi:predicted nucleic acid-binding protein
MNGPRFIDTNILLYSISRDPAQASKRDIAVALLDARKFVVSLARANGFHNNQHIGIDREH